MKKQHRKSDHSGPKQNFRIQVARRILCHCDTHRDAVTTLSDTLEDYQSTTVRGENAKAESPRYDGESRRHRSGTATSRETGQADLYRLRVERGGSQLSRRRSSISFTLFLVGHERRRVILLSLQAALARCETTGIWLGNCSAVKEALLECWTNWSATWEGR